MMNIPDHPAHSHDNDSGLVMIVGGAKIYEAVPFLSQDIIVRHIHLS